MYGKIRAAQLYAPHGQQLLRGSRQAGVQLVIRSVLPVHDPFGAQTPGGKVPRVSWWLWAASPNCLRLLVQLIRLAASRTFWTAGNNSPIRMAMMAITTSNSISVNPRRPVRPRDWSMTTPPTKGSGNDAPTNEPSGLPDPSETGLGEVNRGSGWPANIRTNAIMIGALVQRESRSIRKLTFGRRIGQENEKKRVLRPPHPTSKCPKVHPPTGAGLVTTGQARIWRPCVAGLTLVLGC